MVLIKVETFMLSEVNCWGFSVLCSVIVISFNQSALQWRSWFAAWLASCNYPAD